MFSHKDKGGNKAVFDSPTSSETLQEVVIPDRDIAIPDRDTKQFALHRFSASKKKFYLHNVECTSSRIKDCDLEEIRQRFRIPNYVKMFAPKIGETADNPPKDCYAVYNIMLENGLRLPANDFVNEILTDVERAPAQVSHNSWVILTAFQVACHVSGIKPLVELFKKMYKITSYNKDYIYFSHKGKKNLTLLNLPNKISKWEPYFFFVSSNAFGKKVPSCFCVKTVNFKCNWPDIELHYLEFQKRFTRRLLCQAFLDEKVLLMCNIYKDTSKRYKDANKRPKEDAYAILLKANDALVQSATPKNNQLVLKLIEEENLRSAVVEASDVSGSFKSPEPDTKLKGPTSSAAEIRQRPLEVSSDSDSDNLPFATFINLSATPTTAGCAARFPVKVKTEKVYSHDADEDVEIIDLDKFLLSKKKSSSNMTTKVCSSLPASSWNKISAGKRQADAMHKAIAPDLKKKKLNNEDSILDGWEFATQLFQSPLHHDEIVAPLFPDEIVFDMEEKHIKTNQIPIKEEKRELVKEYSPEVSNLKDQDELDSISIQLDEILKKGAQSHQETSDHRIQMTTILASLEYCHLGSSREKATRQVSNLRKQVDMLHSHHVKLEKCLENYNGRVSDCKNDIEVLNSVRARLETFGLKESPQEVSRLEGQVVQLNFILKQLDASVERSSQLKASLEKSEQQVSAIEDQVKRLIVETRRFDDSSLEKVCQEDSKVKPKSLIAEFESSLKEFNRIEESLKRSAQNVRDLKSQFGQLTSILAQLVVDVEQANKDYKVSSASTKSLYKKARPGEKP